MTINPDNWPRDDYVVKDVQVYDEGSLGITTTDHSGFGITAEEAAGKPVPQAGDPVVLLGGFGRQIEGIIIGGVTYRYNTRAQSEKNRQQWLDEYAAKKQADYEKNIDNWVLRANALDEPFQSRIQRFEGENPQEFWRESGAYELFVVEQANKLYNVAKVLPDPAGWLDLFYKSRWEDQKVAFPELGEGHSGNTFGGMVALARAVARGEDI